MTETLALDYTTIVLCWIGLLVLAPLAVCGIFALRELRHRRRKPSKRHYQFLRRSANRWGRSRSDEDPGRQRPSVHFHTRAARAELVA
jgi:hypothetical protein